MPVNESTVRGARTLRPPRPALPVASDVKPRGNLFPDAHLVALMREHGVSTIWSHDRDLRKFSGITVKDPFSGEESTGFE